MALTKEFKEAVDSAKKTRVRIMLKDIMIVDPSLKAFDEMLTYAEKNMLDLYDLHDGEELNNDFCAWDEDYMNQQMSLVVINFSKERIALLRKIVKKLYVHKIHMETRNSANNSTTSKSEITGVQIVGGIIVAAGASALLGGIIGAKASVAMIGGVAAIAGGIAMGALFGNKEA